MADTYGEMDLRGINIDKLAKGFADEAIVLKQYLYNTTTDARENVYYSKTAGFLDSQDTTGMTASRIANVPSRARPVVVGQTWTKSTAYVRKYMVESELISVEDLSDSNLDLLTTTIRDLVRAVENQVDKRIYNVLSENDTPVNIQTIAVTDEWDDTTNGVPISDLLTAREYIRNYSYDPKGAVLLLRPDAVRFLVNYLIAVKGSSIPNFSSEKVTSGEVMEILGFKVVETLAVTSDYGLVFVPQRAATWKQFVPITSSVIDEPGIGKKIRVWEEGEAYLTDPKAVVLLSNIGPS